MHILSSAWFFLLHILVQASSVVPAPPSPGPESSSVLSTQLTLGLAGAGFLNWLKNNPKFAFINPKSAVWNHAVLLLTSAFGAIGIGWAWNAAAHSLTITGLDIATILPAFWLWAKQWAIQFLVHRGVFGAVAGSPAPASTK